LDEFYQPRFAGDAIAPSALGRVLAIAEKIDTLAGLFAIGQKPTGNKDPFSLRRNALGLARTLIEGGLDLDLVVLLDEAVTRAHDDVQRIAVNESKASGKSGATASVQVKSKFNDIEVHRETIDLYDFVVERLRGYAAERGVRPGAFEAVLALRPTSLADFDQRLSAVVEFGTLPEAEKLAAANKRIGNILRQAGEKAIAIAPSVDAARLEAGAEAALGAAVDAAVAEVAPLLAARRYVDALRRLAALQPAVDAFFDGVMVMVDDAAVRANRLALLARLRAQFLGIADIGLL
jgi:glycyl-tRNA synthetase beta chain